MDTTRQNKISRLIQKELSEFFRKEGSIFAKGILFTVTVVRISPDMGVAKVFLSIFPSNDKEEILIEIRKRSKQIRFELAKITRSQLRSVPELIFYIDDSLDYAEKIDKLLDK
ncbi:30S ribosome-binding factor RbfA [Bacteroidota bacterium]